MSRSEKLILVRDVPSSIISVLDAVLGSQGLDRVAVESISEDFSPLLQEEGGPVAFVLSPPRGDWVACFSSLPPDAESDLAEALARGLEQPVVYALLDGVAGIVAYRYFERGDLHEESLPRDDGLSELDEARLIEKLQAHGIDVALVDDRTSGFGDEHLVVGYTTRQTGADARSANVSENNL